LARIGPFVVLRIVPFRCAGVEQKLRHAFRVEIFVHGGLRRGAERAEQRQHFLLLHQPPRRFDALRRAIGVVHGEEFHLASVDAAVSVHHLEIGFANPAEHPVERARAAVRHGLADFDFGIARTRIVFLLGGLHRCGGREDRGDGGGAEVAPRLVVVHCYCFSLGMHCF
jgi:hypothetical protein